MRIIGNNIISIILVPSVALAIAGCGNKDAEKPKPATQIAAKVNSGEISVHQLNYVLTRTPGAGGVSPEMAPKVRREVLDRLVDQELAVEKAIEKKLDRSPEVLLALENARREILARAYVEQITAGAPKPTIEEAKKYYAENPPLFAERRIYNIQELVLPAAAGVAVELRGMVDAGKSMEEIANWLKGKGIKFAAGTATRSAEQIPLELLPKIHPLKTGQSLILEGPQTVTVMRLAGAQSAPVSEEAALPRIQQFLGNQRAAETAKQELKTLKTNAKITYMGEFADDSKPQTAAKPIVPEAKDPGITTSNAAGAGVVVERGVAGLK
jgi:EpsD family peptidyl-prolyl cis-trans isomerase